VQRWIALVALAMATLAGARAPSGLGIRQPVVLRLEGHFTATRNDARTQGTDAVSIRLGDNERWFAVDTARTVGGDPPVSGRAVLGMLAPLQPTLLAVGDAALRRRLEEAPIGTAVRLEGLVDRGSRTYLLREVVVAPPQDAQTP